MRKFRDTTAQQLIERIVELGAYGNCLSNLNDGTCVSVTCLGGIQPAIVIADPVTHVVLGAVDCTANQKYRFGEIEDRLINGL
jgi:hypothetical protein